MALEMIDRNKGQITRQSDGLRRAHAYENAGKQPWPGSGRDAVEIRDPAICLGKRPGDQSVKV